MDIFIDGRRESLLGRVLRGRQDGAQGKHGNAKRDGRRKSREETLG